MRMKKFACICILLSSLNLFGGEIVNLWNNVPESTAKEAAELAKAKAAKKFVVEVPTLEIFSVKNPKGAVIVCPGGGYNHLAYEKEGTEIAEFLNKQGISAFVLKYRVPQQKTGALQDAQRAIRYVRYNAAKFGVNPNKIAIMGFSAGANLSARASNLYGENSYSPTDEIDKVSPKPNLTGLIYPAYCDQNGCNMRWGGKILKGKTYDEIYKDASELKLSKNTPPVFAMQTLKDVKYVNASIAYVLKLKELGVPAELHLFNDGAHGVGLREKNIPASEWGNLFADWLKYNWRK